MIMKRELEEGNKKRKLERCKNEIDRSIFNLD